MDLLNRDVKTLSDQRQIGVQVLDLFAQEETGDRGIVIDQQTPFAVEQPATWSEHGNLADSVGLGQSTETVRSGNLKPPEPRPQNYQDGGDDILHGMQLRCGKLFCFTSGQLGLWGQFHVASRIPFRRFIASFGTFRVVEHEKDGKGDQCVCPGAYQLMDPLDMNVGQSKKTTIDKKENQTVED